MAAIRDLMMATARNGDQRFALLNREERNFVAILYHVLLLDDGNLNGFLAKVGWGETASWDDYDMAVEWSWLRDLWSTIGRKDRRKVLETALEGQVTSVDWSGWPDEQVNNHFGATPKGSTTTIQSPATWNLAQLQANLPAAEFRAACRLKWAFRVKPDLVITDGGRRALCVEAKWDSAESRYPTSGAERAIWNADTVPQREIQRYLLSDLLGLDTTYRFLVRTAPSQADAEAITWREAFDGLSLSGVPAFICQWVSTLSAA